MSLQKTKNIDNIFRCSKNTNTDSDNLELVKHKESIQHLEDLHRHDLEKINHLESSLDLIARQNEAYGVQNTALKQHNKCLHDEANQLHTQYNDVKILLLNIQEENINLKIENRNLQILHQKELNKIENHGKKKIISLNEFLRENEQITKENLKYLNQIKEIHHKYTKATKKYGNLNNMQINLENELKLGKSRMNELDNIVNEYTFLIKHLQDENRDLKQTLMDKNSDDSYQKKAEPPACRFRSPDFVKTRQYQRSPYESPIVNIYERINLNQFDVYENNDVDMDMDMDMDTDLYQTTNHYLFQMDECVQILSKINDTKNENYLNDEQKQLRTIKDITKRLKNCVLKIRKQQILDTTDNTMKIKQMTKEMYNMQYNNQKKETCVGFWGHFNFWGKWYM
eukprot:9025_1